LDCWYDALVLTIEEVEVEEPLLGEVEAVREVEASLELEQQVEEE